MSERAREPLFFEDEEEEVAPEPATGSAGGHGPPTAVGSGLGEGGGNDEPPGGWWGSYDREADEEGEGAIVVTGIGTGIRLTATKYKMPLEDLHLSMRAYSCLRRSGLITLGQILEMSVEDLLALRNFGLKSYDELRDALDEFGILPIDPDDRDEFGILPDDPE
jgi:hypothetical protein